MDAIEIRAIRAPEAASAYALLQSCGWSHRLGSLADFETLLSRSQRAVVAVEPGGRVVGFARAITDGMSNGYLSMVAVSPELRRQGLGRALVGEATAGGSSITWVLRAGREGATEFFARLGFRQSALAMERSRE